MDEALQRIARVEERSKSNTHRINQMEEDRKTTAELVSSVREIALEVKHMREDQNDVIERLKDLESVPKTRWNEIIKTIVSTIVAGFVAYALLKIGIGV